MLLGGNLTEQNNARQVPNDHFEQMHFLCKLLFSSLKLLITSYQTLLEQQEALGRNFFADVYFQYQNEAHRLTFNGSSGVTDNVERNQL